MSGRRRQLHVPEFVGSWPVVRGPSGLWCTLADLRSCSRPMIGRVMFFELEHEGGDPPPYCDLLKRGKGSPVGEYSSAQERAGVIAWVRKLGRNLTERNRKQ